MELLLGGFVGAVLGVLLAEVVRRYQLPRVEFLGLESTKPERGLAGGEQYLRRIKFGVKGSTVGTATSIRLRWGPGPRKAPSQSGMKRRSPLRRIQSLARSRTRPTWCRQPSTSPFTVETSTRFRS